MHRLYGKAKADLFANPPATIVELGPGAGANLRYLPRGTRLIAVEPNVHMHARLREKAARHGIALELRDAPDIESESVDLVLASLVLCSVDDPGRVVAEVRRVLRAGGRFACIEHVVAPPDSFTRKMQAGLQGPWRWLFEGCDLCRDTAATLRSARFARVDVQPLLLPTAFAPVRYQIAALCVK